MNRLKAFSPRLLKTLAGAIRKLADGGDGDCVWLSSFMILLKSLPMVIP